MFLELFALLGLCMYSVILRFSPVSFPCSQKKKNCYIFILQCIQIQDMGYQVTARLGTKCLRFVDMTVTSTSFERWFCYIWTSGWMFYFSALKSWSLIFCGFYWETVQLSWEYALYVGNIFSFCLFWTWTECLKHAIQFFCH